MIVVRRRNKKSFMKNSRAGRELQTIWLCRRLGKTDSYRQALFSAMLWNKSRLTACWSHSNLLHENTFWREEQQGSRRKVFISERLSLGQTWKMQIFYLFSRSPYPFGRETCWLLRPLTCSTWSPCSLTVLESLFLFHQGLVGTSVMDNIR